MCIALAYLLCKWYRIYKFFEGTKPDKIRTVAIGRKDRKGRIAPARRVRLGTMRIICA
ncbi:MAG: hypothetical protein K0Q77_1830 [Anaerosporomusa subterranea]|nr:hypothetical protein [Anaerosporomusa subterranea]